MLQNEFSYIYDLEEYCKPNAVMEAEDLWGFQNEITELDKLVEIKKNDKSTIYKTLRERLHNLTFILERIDLGQILIRGL